MQVTLRTQEGFGLDTRIGLFGDVTIRPYI